MIIRIQGMLHAKSGVSIFHYEDVILLKGPCLEAQIKNVHQCSIVLEHRLSCITIVALSLILGVSKAWAQVNIS
jgi:hypothetical protein